MLRAARPQLGVQEEAQRELAGGPDDGRRRVFAQRNRADSAGAPRGTAEHAVIEP
jgi:hypothetical protein